MKNEWKEEEVARFLAMHENRVWTRDEDALNLLLWLGADVIWSEGPVMMKEGQFLVDGRPQDPAGFPPCEVRRGYGSLRKGEGL
ncbi:hypothetical protein [Faecalibaculum rodentium]|uniref:hypothetical protein n=1 Tax=Faecalibaculum rodentium TaxID=1702221 RepID=UPI0023F00B4A|nr:hypothetical protein [Faecalibaculum rodentium]